MKLSPTLKVPYKLTRVATEMARYLGRSGLIYLRTKDEDQRLRHICANVQRAAREGLDILGFDVEVIGHDLNLMKEKSFLIVGNHLSYMDILVLASVQPSIFVTSVDMGEVPLLGQLAAAGGSLFVERRHRDHRERDLRAMAEVMKRGFNVLLYPEGTSTDGLTLLPFKKSLLMSAVEAGVDILPITVRYVTIDGREFGPENCDDIAWYGDMGFASHLIQLMQKNQIKARLEFLPPIAVSSESTRDELAKKTYDAISASYFSQTAKQILPVTFSGQVLEA